MAVISGIGTVRIKHTPALRTTHQAQEGFGKTLRKNVAFNTEKLCYGSAAVTVHIQGRLM